MNRLLSLKSIAIIAIFLCCISCIDINKPEKNSKINLTNLILYGNFPYNDSCTIIALLCHNAGQFYSGPINPEIMSDLTGYFTDDYKNFVNLTSLKVENIPLNLIIPYTGQYSGTVDLNSLSDSYFSWQIQGYLGIDTILRQNFAKQIVFTNFKFADTINKSQGKTITYTGFIENGILNLNIQYDAAATMIYKNDTTGYSTDGVIKYISDNGKIDISSQDLSNLAPGRYYYLIMDHDLYETSPFAGDKLIGKYSKYHITTTFYLAE